MLWETSTCQVDRTESCRDGAQAMEYGEAATEEGCALARPNTAWNTGEAWACSKAEQSLETSRSMEALKDENEGPWSGKVGDQRKMESTLRKIRTRYVSV